MSPPSEARLTYTYRAARADGAEEVGDVHAATLVAARGRLVAAGLFPIEINEPRARLDRRARVPVADLAVGLRLLSSLLGAGLPMERALGILQHVAPTSWGEARVNALRNAVREGSSLASALRDAELGVPSHVTGIIAAGESAGTLVESLRETAALVERTAEQRAAIHGALAYPALLAVSGMVSVSLLVGIVLPRFAALLADVGQQLPTAARLLLALSSAIESWWWLILGGPLVLGAWITRRLTSNTASRYRFLEWMLALPLIGPLRHATAGARVSSALASMLDSGVPLANALSHASGAAGDDAIATRVLRARDAVIRGERLSQALAETAGVRPSVLQLIRAGEASGEMVEMLRTSARIESEWSLSRVRTLTKLIEPLLILGFGAIIAFVAAALLQAVYSIRPTT